ncbi:MAG: zinc ribbon domain-containing protein [Cocleimonas sp.]
MPIYDFQCQSCGNEVEVLQRISDDPLKNCEACGKPDMKKKVSAAAFRLSGAGWYETDFKKGKKKNLTQKDDKPSSNKKTEKTKVAEAKKSTSKSPT